MDRGDRSLIGVEVEWGKTVNMGNFENIKPIVRLPAYVLTNAEFAACNDYSDIVDKLFGKCEMLIDREVKFQKRLQKYNSRHWSLRRLKDERENIGTEGFSIDQLKVLNENIDRMIAEAEAEAEEKRQGKLKELDSMIDSANYDLGNGNITEGDAVSMLPSLNILFLSRTERMMLFKMKIGDIIGYQAEELLPLLSVLAPSATSDSHPF